MCSGEGDGYTIRYRVMGHTTRKADDAQSGVATAIFDDFASVISNKLPLFIAIIVALGFVLLLIAFRTGVAR
jgi:hypothetical protein